jgi:hypothetical protein
MAVMCPTLVRAVVGTVEDMTVDQAISLLAGLGYAHHTFFVHGTACEYNLASLKTRGCRSLGQVRVTFNGGPGAELPYYGTVTTFVSDRVLRAILLSGLGKVEAAVRTVLEPPYEEERSDEWDEIASWEASPDRYAG